MMTMDSHGDNDVLFPSQTKSLFWARILADLLTLVRGVSGVLLPLMPRAAMSDALGRLVKCNVLLWSTDAVDGRLARLSGTPPSWIGQRDIWVDVTLTLGTALALVRTGYLSRSTLGAWVLLCGVLYTLKPVDTVLLVFMFPLQLTLPICALLRGCPEVKLYLLFVMVLLVVNWSRLRWVIEVFINGLPPRLQDWVWSWLPRWLRLTPQEREFFRSSLREGETVGLDNPGHPLEH